MRLATRVGRTLHLLFFLSGAAGLIYEVIWTRWLTGILGSAAAATAIVLAVFMAGLGIGSWLSARVADRTARPIRLFALLELGVVALVLLPLWEVGWMTVVLTKLASWTGPVSAWLDVARFTMAAIAIGPPTVLMGASLPVIVRALATSPQLLGRSMATAYAANSLGGVCGTLLAGFLLMETLGLRGACLTAGALGALVGGLALWLDRRVHLATSAAPGEPAEAPARVERPARSRRGKQRKRTPLPARIEPQATPERPAVVARAGPFWVLVAAGVSGFCALGYETIWCRVLSLLTLNTTYAFSLMLAVLLCGLSLGSWLMRGRLDRMKHPAEWFAALQTLLSLYALSSLLWAADVVQLAEWLVPGGNTGMLQPWLGRPLVLAVSLLLVPTTLMGASLPVACKLYGLLTGGVGQPVGRTYAANTFGSVLGSLVVGLLVIPAWGTWWAVAWAYAPGRRRHVCATVATAAAIASVVFGMVLGGTVVTRQGIEPHDVVLFSSEDEYGLVEVIEDSRIGTRCMLTNRLHREGSNLARTVAEQRRQGLLPLLLHPSPRRVLEVGLGTGVKLGVLQSPIVERAVVVEISPAVVRASRLFADYNHGVASQDRSGSCQVRLECADGRNFLALSSQEFDVIVNGLLTPYRAGVSRLYTLEHFRTCRAKLAPDGVFVVWVAIRQIAPEDFKVLVRTQLEVFPHTTMWLDGYYLALVSTPGPPVWDADEILRRCEAPALREALEEASLDSPIEILATFVAGAKTLDRFAGPQPCNTEDRPIIEFRTPRLGDRLDSRELAAESLHVLRLLQEPLCPGQVTAVFKTRTRIQRAQRARATARLALVQKCRGRHIEATKLFMRALTLDSTDGLARHELETYMVAHGKQCLERGLFDQAYRVFRQAVGVNPRSIGALASLAALEEKAGNRAEAEKLWHRALSLDPHNQHIRTRLAKLQTAGTARRY